VHPNSKIFASVSPDQTMKVWQVEWEKPLFSKQAHTGKIFWVKYSKSGQMLATAGADHTAKIWDCKNLEKPLYTVKSIFIY